MSDNEDLDYNEPVEAEEEVVDRKSNSDGGEDSPSFRHARVAFPSDEEGAAEEEEAERRDEERPLAMRRTKKKKMPWATEREAAEERRREKSEVKITPEAQDALYRELRVGPSGGGGAGGGKEARGASARLDTIIVKGADGMRPGQLEKIFGDYFPYKAEMADAATGLVYFRSSGDAARMLLGMTKRLRRVRVKKAPEEGEVRDSSDEEEGELRQEGGDDVAVEDEEVGAKTIKAASVEINVDDVALPEGKWRVVTEHVPDAKLLLARFAAHEDVMAGRAFREAQGGEGGGRKRRSNESRDGFKYTWMEEKTRAGLNIFDKDGNELDWDYEHDTRFYEDPDETAVKEDEAKDEEMMAAWPAGVKVRGRGAGRARFGIKEASMNADDEKGGGASKKRRIGGGAAEIPISRRLASRVTGGVFADDEGEGEEEDLRRDEEEEEDEADADPTPQSWNKHRSGLEGRVTFQR